MSWDLPIPYFDGRCEAVCRGRTGRSRLIERCRQVAKCVRDGWAVCPAHRTGEAPNYDPDASRFRHGEYETLAQRIQKGWDF